MDGTTIAEMLRAEAVRRGLFPDDKRLTREAAYVLVRDMRYERASDREPATLVREWRGTCSGKHYLLRAVLQELGTPVTLLHATHEFTEHNSPWLPPALRELLRPGPVRDVHTFLRVQPSPTADWMTVDATFPLAAKPLGLPVNETWVDGRDMVLAADPIEVFHVPDEEDPQAFKERLLEMHVGGQAHRREEFIQELSDWLVSMTRES